MRMLVCRSAMAVGLLIAFSGATALADSQLEGDLIRALELLEGSGVSELDCLVTGCSGELKCQYEDSAVPGVISLSRANPCRLNGNRCEAACDAEIKEVTFGDKKERVFKLKSSSGECTTVCAPATGLSQTLQ
ncbi:MAG: hypothetical protein KDD44_03980 [Bdellovibrionales bacterium]|nr:hypothetical protein [Bdellovibrionales bacterium]